MPDQGHSGICNTLKLHFGKDRSPRKSERYLEGAYSVLSVGYKKCIDKGFAGMCIISFRRVMDLGHDESKYRTTSQIQERCSTNARH